MIKEISTFRGLLHRKSAVIVGSAPTMDTVVNHVDNIGFWLGDAHLRTSESTKSSYYVRANSEYPNLNNPLHVDELNGRGFVYCLAETVMESDEPVSQLAASVLDSDTYVFDQRHFGGEKCSPEQPCCSVISGERVSRGEQTLQEILARESGLPHHYSTADTVALHAFALAILGDCSEVSLTGIELPLLQRDYVYAGISDMWERTSLNRFKELITNLKTYRPTPMTVLRRGTALLRQKIGIETNKLSIFAPDFPRLFSDFQYLTDVALSRGVRVYYCSSTSNLKFVNGIEACPRCLGV